MTQAEGAVVAKCVQGINHILAHHGDKLDAYEKEFLRDCISRAQAMADNKIQQAQDLVVKGKRWQNSYTAPIQTELFNEKGEFVEDAEAKALEKANKKAAKKEAKANKGKGKNGNVVNLSERRAASQDVQPKDGEQLALGGEEGTVTTKSGTLLTFRTTPGVPKGVEMGLIQVVQDGGNQKKAIAQVAKQTGQDESTVGSYWDKLVETGRLELVKTSDGKKAWVANLPEDQPVAAVSG